MGRLSAPPDRSKLQPDACAVLDMQRGLYRLRAAQGAADLAATQVLRGRAFGRPGGQPDHDGFDARCTHVLIEQSDTGQLVGCFRLLDVADSAALERSYSAQFYDLSCLAPVQRPLVELGRFCLAPGCGDPDILRLAWAGLTAYVDARGAGMLFGCTSFAGTDPARYGDSFAQLARAHLAPAHRRPGPRAPLVHPLRDAPHDALRARAGLPPLLRTYLGMGGWVSDHAVIDHHMNTLHVFTGVEIDAIPEPRKRLLRALLR